MSESINVVKELLRQYEAVKELNDAKQEERSEIDRELSNFYHHVEGINITHVSQSHKLIKELKVILNKRRDNKLEGLVLKTTLDSIKVPTSHIKGSINRVVTTHKKVIDEMKERANNR